jgi:hypothetical protein
MTNPDVFLLSHITDFAEQSAEQEQMHQVEQDEGIEDVVAHISPIESPGKICVPRISAFATLPHFFRHNLFTRYVF